MRIDGVIISDRMAAAHLATAISYHERRLRHDGVEAPDFLARLITELIDFAKSGKGPAVQRPEPSEPAIADFLFSGPTMTAEAVAEELGVSGSMVARYCRSGKLPARKQDGVWQIDPIALAAFRRQKESDERLAEKDRSPN